MMSSLASLVVRRRRAVITLWIVFLIGAGTIGSSAFSVLSSNFGAGPRTESGRVTEQQAWERITHFLERVVPVAEEFRVRLACHPHDPGAPPSDFGSLTSE